MRSEVPTEKEIDFQHNLIKTVEQGWIDLPGAGPLYSHLYFIVLRRLMKLLTFGKKGDETRRWVSAKYGRHDSNSPRGHYVALEWLDVTTRRAVLGLASELLVNWPDRFVECCVANKLSRHTLFNHMDYVPYWYWNTVRWHLTAQGYEPSDQEIESALRCLYKGYDKFRSITPRDVDSLDLLRCLYKGYDKFRSLRRLPGSLRPVARFVAEALRSRRWRRHLIADRTKVINSSSKRLLAKGSERISTPIPRLIPEALWGQLEGLIPKSRPYRKLTDSGDTLTDRIVLSGIGYVFANHCAWTDIPSEFGNFEQVYAKYKKWKHTEGFEKALALVLQWYRDEDRR